jgi:O-antigen/teichoic acid export membrane protein
MFSGRRIVHNILLLTLSPLLRVLVSVPLAGLIARQLGVEGYGELNFALAFAALLGVTANLGLNETFLRTAAQQPAGVPRLWSSVLVVKLALVGGYLGILLVLAQLFGHSGRMVALILLLGVYQGGLSLENTTFAVFSARQRMKPVAGLGTAKFVVEVAVTVAVLLAGATAVGLAASRALVGVVAVGAVIILARRSLGIRFGSPSATAVRPLVVSGLSFAAITTLWSIQTRAGVLLLAYAHGLEAVALFSAAMVPVERLFMFFPAIQDAMYPVFSAFEKDDAARFESTLARSVRYQCLFGVGLGLGVSLAGPWALRLLFPVGLHAAGAVLEILGIAVTLRALNVLLTTAALARGLERPVMWITVFQCVATVSSAALLVGPFGAPGLAWATVVSDAACLLALVAMLCRRGALRTPHLAYFIPPAAAGVVLFLACDALPSGRDGLLVPLAFAAGYPVFLVLSRVVSREDLGYLMAVVARDGRSRKARTS